MAHQLLAGPSGLGVEALTGDYLETVGGNFDKVFSRDQSDDGGVLMLGIPHFEGREVETDNLPTALRRKPARADKLADLYPAPKSMFYISPAFKDVLEAFDPNVHQVVPLELTLTKGKTTPFYLLNVCQRISALSAEHCIPPLDNRRLAYMPKHDGNDVLAFEKAGIEGRHLWYDKHFVGMWMSNQLMSALRDAQLSGVSPTSNIPEY